VRAASINSPADFFFQVHSKTAARSHVRLYLNGQPRRMSIDESIADVWSWWKLMCGALSKNEVDTLSKEKLNTALKIFGGLDNEDLNINALQTEIRESINRGMLSSELLEKIMVIENKLSDGRKMILSQKQVCLEWPKEPGAEINRCTSVPVIRGLSTFLRDVLLSTVDQTQNKLQRLKQIVKKYGVSTPVQIEQQIEEENGPELDIESDFSQPSLSWGTVLESVKEESYGFNHIASFGDFSNGLSPGTLRPPFLIDEF
jgi:hypothetical protein